MLFGGGSGGAVPLPDRRTEMEDSPVSVAIETVPAAGAVALGEKTILKDVNPDGGMVTGRPGKFAKAKKLPLKLMAVTVMGLFPVFLKLMERVEEVKMGTSPKDTGFGRADRPEAGWPTAENVTGLPVSPVTDAVTEFGPGKGPRVRVTEAWPWTFVFTAVADSEPPPVAIANATGTLASGPPDPTTVTTKGLGRAVPDVPTWLLPLVSVIAPIPVAPKVTGPAEGAVA